MRKSIIARTTDITNDDAPKQPSPGDVCIGCMHRPEPEDNAHYYYRFAGIEFQRPDGTQGVAKWLLICDACFIKHGDRMHEDLLAGKVKIACDLKWPEGATVNFTKR